MSFEKAVQELESIIERIEQGEVNIGGIWQDDHVVENVPRPSEDEGRSAVQSRQSRNSSPFGDLFA